MIKKLLLPLCLFFLASVRTNAQPPPGPASEPAPVQVIARNGADREVSNVSENGIVPMVLVRQNQVIPVTLQFSTDRAGTPVATTALDGGKINSGTSTVLPTGKFVFTFSPGPMPGRYRVMVRTPREQHLLEFYVVDPNNPPFKSRASRN